MEDDSDKGGEKTKKEYYVVIGILIVLLVGAALMSSQKTSGQIVILYTDSGIKQLNPWQTYRWKTYYLKWQGDSTTIYVQGEIWGSYSLEVYNGKTFSVYATDSNPVTITYDGKTIQFTA